MFIENEEVFSIDYDVNPSKKIIYVPLRSYLALADNKIADRLLSKDKSNEKNLFFEMLQSRQLLNMHEIINNLHSAIPELSLAITDNCTLRCVYCHASAGEKHKRSTMSTEMIDTILDKYFEFIGTTKVVKMSFNGGGEPTFNFNRLTYAIKKAKELSKNNGSKCVFTMATNGYYGDKVREFIVNNFSEISLSFDGPDFIHNRHRPTQNGGDSFSTVYKTAKYFYKTKLPFAFRATVSNYSIKHLTEIIDFIATEFPNKSIGLEHLNLFGRAKYSQDILPPKIDEFSDKIVFLLDYTKNKPVKILNSASTEYDLIRPVFCSNVGIPNWTVDVSGDIIACSRDNAPIEFVFGKYDFETNKLTLDHDKITSLRELVVSNYKECENCFCKYHCAGDCPDRRIEEKYDCDSIKKIGKHILQEKLFQNQEVKHANTISSTVPT